jgi:magnesium chelatase family protein
VPALAYEELARKEPGEGSEAMRQRVIGARERQLERYRSESRIYCNAHMESRHIRKYCELDEQSRTLLKNAIDRLGLSARAYDRILKVSRTVADLDDSPGIQSSHIAEAIQYRSLDRKLWMGG